jgi:hypothetical protein
MTINVNRALELEEKYKGYAYKFAPVDLNFLSIKI